MEVKLPKIHYSPQGYCKGFAVIKKLATTGKKWRLANLSSCTKAHSKPQIRCLRQTQFTRQALFFFHTTLKGVVGAAKYTNML